MINLSSLSALIRTIRHTSGLNAPATPVDRVASVAPVAGDDAGAMTSTGVRPSPWTRAHVNPLELAAETETREVAMRREAPGHVTRGPTQSAGQSRAAAVATADDGQSTALDFTAGARLLQAALRGSGLTSPKPPAITSPMPLVTSSRTPAPELAARLAGAVAESGLFYESHLARALQRDYPMGALAREPQASWPATAAEGLSASTSASALPEAASTMLTKQLDLLETRSLVWSGDLWPGQHATVDFEEYRKTGDAPEDADEARAAPSWRMRVTLDLPSLGRVHATLGLDGNALDLALTAAGEDTQARLTSARAELVATLAGAQLALNRFDVGRDPGA